MCILACHAFMYTYVCGTEKIVGARAYRAGNVASSTTDRNHLFQGE